MCLREKVNNYFAVLNFERHKRKQWIPFFYVLWPYLGLIPTRHFDAQYCDIAMKRYFSSNIFFPVWIENIYLCLFESILKCNCNILTKKCLFIFLYFFRNFFLSFYLNIVCKILCVKKAFKRKLTDSGSKLVLNKLSCFQCWEYFTSTY